MLNQTVNNIKQWSNDRGIIKGTTAKDQTLKLGSEMGELCDNILKGRHLEARDDIGDMFVVLTNIAEQIGSSIEECIEVAYNDIKDRKGVLLNGSFIKEQDLFSQGWIRYNNDLPVATLVDVIILNEEGYVITTFQTNHRVGDYSKIKYWRCTT